MPLSCCDAGVLAGLYAGGLATKGAVQRVIGIRRRADAAR